MNIELPSKVEIYIIRNWKINFLFKRERRVDYTHDTHVIQFFSSLVLVHYLPWVLILSKKNKIYF